MDKTDLMLISDEIEYMIGTEELLEAIIRSLSSEELEDVLKFIDRCYDLDIF